MTPERLEDSAPTRRITRRRLLAALALVLPGVGALAARIGYLQTVQYSRYRKLSRGNRVARISIPPTRGLIYDRNGVLLADNETARRLVVIPEGVRDLDATLRRLEELVTLESADVERFWELKRTQRPFQRIPLKPALTERETARLAVNRHRLPGVEVVAHLVRHYPQGHTAVHAVGYVGRISAADMQELDPTQYQGLSYVGKTGVERYYEERLRGRAGIEWVETDASGRTLRTLEREPPVPGEDLYLSLDVRLQRVAESALGQHSGALIAMEPTTGELLAVASTPTFDPNPFVRGISRDDYGALQTRADNPLFNRSVRGQYPPGSTIKPFLALAGLEAGTISARQEVNCPGWYSLPGVKERWRCWKRGGHGRVSLRPAIAESCDVYFYDLAYKLGIEAMHDRLAGFGFGAPTGVDIPGEESGVLPSKAWKRRTLGEPWYHGETIIAGIGQGYFQCTPMQLAAAAAVMANRGKEPRPHLLKATREPEGSKVTAATQVEAEMRASQARNAQWLRAVIGAMEAVVHGERGTARAVGEGISYRMAGKTGTSQVVGLSPGENYDAEATPERFRDHALFVAFAPTEQPSIATAVLVENGGSGSSTAAPMARAVMDAWLDGLSQESNHG